MPWDHRNVTSVSSIAVTTTIAVASSPRIDPRQRFQAHAVAVSARAQRSGTERRRDRGTATSA